MSQENKGKKLLIVRLSSLGDCVFNIPMANLFKKNGYRVDWIVSEKGMILLKTILVLIRFTSHLSADGKSAGSFLLEAF